MAPDFMQLCLQAEAGDARAQFSLAHMLLLGAGAAPSPSDGMRWLRAACAQKYPDALRWHAMLATIGLHRPRSFEDALQMLAVAADGGDASAKGQLAALGGVSGFDAEAWTAAPKTVQVGARPRIFTIENFIPKEACAWLIEQARPRQSGAEVLDAIAGGYVLSEDRTGTMGDFSKLYPDVVMQLVQLRIVGVTGIPYMHQENIAILRYCAGQEYRPHFDFVDTRRADAGHEELAAWGQRVGTLLIYLNDDYEGGETAFPLLNWRFKGKQGDALLFWNVSATGELEQGSLHAGLPVTRGEKWLWSKWMRARPLPLI